MPFEIDFLIVLVVQGASIGISATSTPGPLQAYLVNETLLRGWKKSYVIAFAPLLADLITVPLILFVLNQIPPGFLNLIRITGAILLLYMAFSILKQLHSDSLIQENSGDFKGFRWAVLMTLLSPAPYLFWSLVNGPILIEALEISIVHGAAFLISFYTVFIGGMVALALVFDRARQLGTKFVRAMMISGVLALIIFSILLMIEVLGNTIRF